MRLPFAFTVSIACLATLLAAVAPVSGDDSPSMFEMPILSSYPGPFLISEVDANGTAKVVNQGFPNRAVPFIEGYYLMVLQGDGPDDLPRLLRVQLSDVGVGVLTLQIGEEAAGRLRAGERCHLWRPEGSTTARLRGLPAVIPVDRDTENEQTSELKVAGGKAGALDRSRRNLWEIGKAIYRFEAEYGYFPPAVIRGPGGAPWHSWRVLLLPYLGQEALYQSYDFSQPWDGEKNRALMARMPDVYRDAIRQDEPAHFTDYAALVGDGPGPKTRGGGPRVQTVLSPAGLTMKDADTLPFARPAGSESPRGAVRGTANRVQGIQPSSYAAPPQGVARIALITDGTMNTAIVATVTPERKIPWTKPEDISVGPDFPLELDKPGGITAPYVVGEAPDSHRAALVLFADGAARAVTDQIRPDVLLALLTRNGGEVINWGQGSNRFTFPNKIEGRPTIVLDCDKGRAMFVNKMVGRRPGR
jgi:hypothetical protein